jgi:hypothetical protein
MRVSRAKACRKEGGWERFVKAVADKRWLLSPSRPSLGMATTFLF